MTSTIRTCSYSSSSEAASILQDRQIKLLNRGGVQDISNRVGRLVSKHLGYKGNQIFEAEITKTKITFTVPGETRVLEYTNNKWQLTRSGSTALSETTEIPATVQSEITEDINDALNRIHNAANFKPDDSSSSPPAPSSPVMHEPSGAVAQINERLGKVEQRLDQLISHLSNPAPRHDSSPDIAAALLAIQRELQGLREAVQHLARPETAYDADRIRELEKIVAESTRVLEGVQQKHQEEMQKARAEIQQLKETLASLRAVNEKAAAKFRENNETLAQQIEKLKAELSDKNEALEAAQRKQKEASEKAASTIAGLEKTIAAMKQEAQSIIELKAANEIQHQALLESIEALKQQLEETQKNQTDLKATATAAIAENAAFRIEMSALRSQIEQMSKAKAELEEQLRTLESTSTASQGEFARKNSELEAQIKAQTEALRAAEGKLNANQALAQQQADQLETLKASLAAETAKAAELEKEKELQAQQIAALTAEKATIERQLAEQQERLRTITQEKTRVERVLQEAQAHIEKQNQELELLRKYLEAMKAGKAEQLRTSTARAAQERAATTDVEREVEAMLKKFTQGRTLALSSKVALL
jgi:chromosome segregation ATPase